MKKSTTLSQNEKRNLWPIFRNLGLACLTALIYLSLYPPFEFTGLAFIALAPWLMLVVECTNRRQWLYSYIAGLLFYFLGVFWIIPITIPGYISMSLYLGLYFPVTGHLIRLLIRRAALPLFLAVPVAWVIMEFLRAWMITGFPWFFLGHSQVKFLPFIQIADMFGAYGVSFVIALINGAIAQIFLSLTQIDRFYEKPVIASRPEGTARQSHPKSRDCFVACASRNDMYKCDSKTGQFENLRKNHYRNSIIPAVSAIVVFIIVIGYGTFRLGQKTQTLGPTVTVVQEDFPLFVDSDCADLNEVLQSLMGLSAEAAVEKPDLIVWPETCIEVSINPEFLNAKKKDIPEKYLRRQQPYGKDVAEILSKQASIMNSYLIVGAISHEFNPPDKYPRIHKFNSAMIYDRKGNYVDRYDKIRLVLFGEVVPFRFSIPWLYRFLNENMTPYGRGGFEYSLTAGEQRKRFLLPTKQGNFNYSIAICYEDTMADLITEFVSPENGKKQIDFLVNISNDGWFNHSCELLQHLYICAFRAVENRISIARSVNTGVSGFIDPSGRIIDMVTDGARVYGKGIRGYSSQTIPVDSRVTIYSKWKDVPLKGILTLIVLAGILRKKFHHRSGGLSHD